MYTQTWKRCWRKKTLSYKSIYTSHLCKYKTVLRYFFIVAFWHMHTCKYIKKWTGMSFSSFRIVVTSWLGGYRSRSKGYQVHFKYKFLSLKKIWSKYDQMATFVKIWVVGELLYVILCYFLYASIISFLKISFYMGAHLCECFVCHLSWFAMAVMKKYHRVALNNGNIFSHSSEGWESKIKMPAGLFSGEDFLLAYKSLPYCVLTWPFLIALTSWGHGSIEWGPASFNCNYLFKGCISKYSHMGARASAYEFGGGVTMQSIALPKLKTY